MDIWWHIDFKNIPYYPENLFIPQELYPDYPINVYKLISHYMGLTIMIHKDNILFWKERDHWDQIKPFHHPGWEG